MRERLRNALLGAWLLFSGCAAPVASIRGVERTREEAGTLTLRLQARRPDDASWYTIGMGETLHSGDRVQAFIQLERTSYVYVVQFLPGGRANVLFPAVGANPVPLPGGIETRIPERGYSLMLDEATGEEHVYIVTSEKPLDQVDRAVAAAVDQVMTSAATEAGTGAGSTPASSGAGMPGQPAGGPSGEGGDEPAIAGPGAPAKAEQVPPGTSPLEPEEASGGKASAIVSTATPAGGESGGAGRPVAGAGVAGRPVAGAGGRRAGGSEPWSGPVVRRERPRHGRIDPLPPVLASGSTEAPTLLAMATRGLGRVEDDDSIRWSPDEHGIAIIRFSFHHAP